MPVPRPSGAADYGSRSGPGPRAATLPTVASSSHLGSSSRRGAGPPPIDTQRAATDPSSPGFPSGAHPDGPQSAPRLYNRGTDHHHSADSLRGSPQDTGAGNYSSIYTDDRRTSPRSMGGSAEGPPGSHSGHGHSPTYRSSPTLPGTSPQGHDHSSHGHGQPAHLTAGGSHIDPSLAAPSRPPASSSGSSRAPCAKCNAAMTGQFVRALGTVYHLDCFRCQDCGKVVASKFFPVDGLDGKQYPLCETDYFKRLNLICAKCGGALRGSYITALDMKFHVEHFTCSVCPTVFGPQDSYYEHDGQVYCHFHYSTRFAVKCTGCQTAILKQFVEINRNSNDEHWHPECYMIHKFWNIKLAKPPATRRQPTEDSEQPGENAAAVIKLADGPDLQNWQQQEAMETAQSLRDKQRIMEEQVYRIWTVLSTFEESSAACISEMLRHVSNGLYLDGVRMAEKFVLHVETLFAAIDDLGALFRAKEAREISHLREARMLCKKIVNFFSLLSHTHESGASKMSITQELLSLVTGLAHYLKILIRIALTGSLRLERDFGDRAGLSHFLGRLDRLARDPNASKPTAPAMVNGNGNGAKLRTYGYKSLSRAVGTLIGQGEATTDLCEACRLTVEDECARYNTSLRWHVPCLRCVSCGATPARERPPPANEDAGPMKPLRSFCAEFAPPREGGGGRLKPLRVYCGDCAVTQAQAQGETRAQAQAGFEAVTRLEQYAFLLCVALNKLYGLLKSRGVLSSPTDPRAGPPNGHDRSLYDAYRNSADIKRMKSVDLDRKLSTTARIPQRSTVVESPSGRVAQSSEGPVASGSNVRLDGRDPRAQYPRPPASLPNPAPRMRPPRDIPPITFEQAPPASSPRPGPQRPAGLLPSNDPTLRPTLSRNMTAVRIVDEPPDRGQLQDEPRLGDSSSPIRDDGITLADLPRAMEAEQLREQHRPLPTQSAMISELSALESIIVKHVAALTLANSAIRDDTNMDELMEIIEIRKGNFWGKLFKGNQDKNKIKKKGVFGVPLDILIERHGVDSLLGAGAGQLRVPSFLDDCISAMRQMDMSVEGIFRKNGNIRRLKELSDALDRDDGSVSLTDDNPVQLAALLKKFLRELPDPLLTFKLHRLFIATQRIDDEQARRKALHLVCLLLPKAHRDSMEVLFVFMKWVASFSHVDEETGSKMDLQNLATVITPNILYARAKDASRDESFLAIRAVHELLEWQDEVFQVPEEVLLVMQDQELLMANPNELTSKDILKRVDALMKANAGRPRPTNRPSEQYRGKGEVHPHRPDLHASSSGYDGSRSVEQRTSFHPSLAVANGMVPPPPSGSPRMAPWSGYGSPAHSSPRERYEQLPPSRTHTDPRLGGAPGYAPGPPPRISLDHQRG